MLAFGYILLIIGCILRMWLRLSAKAETRAMTPRRVSERACAIQMIKKQRKRGFIESGIMIAAGILIILFTGLLN